MSTASISLNISVGATGAIPTPPATINATLINYVTATNPGYTILPGALIEDISSTDTAAIALIDSAAIDLINSLTPYTANPWLLNQLGNIYGVPKGIGSNTSVYVVFSGTVGLVIAAGNRVGDGTYQYIVQDGGVIGSGGTSQPLYCVASQAGSWAVPPGSVTSLITPPPTGYTLTCTNPNSGTPGADSQTEEDYRAQVLEAGLAPAQGMATYLKAQIKQVPGVQPRLVSVQAGLSGYEIIVGGGDPYYVAYAIFAGVGDLSTLVGSTINILSVTKANPGVATTDLNHGLTTGQNNVHIAGATGMTTINGGPYTVTVIDEKTFSFGVNTTSAATYTGNGVVTPNPRNISVSLADYPDTYTIPFVNPPQQTVQIQLTWNTTYPNVVSPSAVQQVGAPALAAYVNSVAVGAPMNLFELQDAFQAATASLIPTEFLTRMVFTVSINGVSTAPQAGTGIIAGDPESYFYCTSANVTITQG